MENNENLNNQVNENNNTNQQVKQNNNKVLIILMALIIVGMAGYIVYTKFVQKTDNSGTQEQENNQQQVNDNTNINKDTSTGVKSKKINLLGQCNDLSESLNNVKVELKKATESERCMYELKINNKKISTDEWLEIDSVEFYENYVIVFVSQDGGDSIYLVNTQDTNFDIYDGVEYYHTENIVGCPLGFNPNSYVSDEDGIIIDATSIWGQCGITDPGYNYAKIRVKYVNGKFGSPEIIEKITNK